MAALAVTLACSSVAFQGGHVSERSSAKADMGTRLPAAESDGRPMSALRSETCNSAKRGLRFYTKRAREWRERMGAGKGSAGHFVPNLVIKEPGKGHCPQLRRAAEIARWNAWKARYYFERWYERMLEKWRCIHEHEGAWNDPNPTYYGGLQMDLSFQRSHGREFLERWGTADKWPVWAQLLAAEDAYRTRGFGPWPTYYRYCAMTRARLSQLSLLSEPARERAGQ